MTRNLRTTLRFTHPAHTEVVPHVMILSRRFCVSEIAVWGGAREEWHHLFHNIVMHCCRVA